MSYSVNDNELLENFQRLYIPVPLKRDETRDELYILVVRPFHLALEEYNFHLSLNIHLEDQTLSSATVTPLWTQYDSNRLSKSLKSLNTTSISIGDAKLSYSSFHHLLKDENSILNSIMPTSKENRTTGWLDDEIINAVTVVLSNRSSRKDFAFLNSQTVSIFADILHGAGPYKNSDTREKILSRLVLKVGQNPRKGTQVAMQHAQFILAPCHVAQSHWILVIVDRMSRSVQYADSLPGSALHAEVLSFCEIVAQLVMAAELQMPDLNLMPPIEVLGGVEGYPQQTNHYDCGIFVCLAAQAATTGVRPAVDEDSIQIWRRCIAASLLDSANS